MHLTFIILCPSPIICVCELARCKFNSHAGCVYHLINHANLDIILVYLTARSLATLKHVKIMTLSIVNSFETRNLSFN